MADTQLEFLSLLRRRVANRVREAEIVMTTARALVIFALLLSLGGCDGYLVTLNIREQQAAHEKAHRRTLYNCGGENVLELVRAVAESLNLIEATVSTEATSQNKYKWRSPDGRFMLFLENQNGGLWRLELVDWPDSSQSELSAHAEAKIRESVKTSCSSSQAS